MPSDVLLLTFGASEEANRVDALGLVDSELATCLYLERFEFIQKHLVLRLWKGEPVSELEQAWHQLRSKLED